MIQKIQGPKLPPAVAPGKVPSKPELEAFLENNELKPLSSKPDLTGFVQVFISDSRMVDGPRIDAWVNPQTREVYKQVTGAGMGGPHTVGPFWYGPAKLGAGSFL